MSAVGSNLNYIVSMLLFSLGLWMLIMQSNLIKKLIGLNIMETSVFFFIVSIGYMKGGVAPIVVHGEPPSIMVNPIPQALVLTGIVVAVSTTAVALSLTIKLYKKYGTLNVEEFEEGKD